MPYKNKADKREYQRKYMAKLRAKQKKLGLTKKNKSNKNNL
jgi:hypothetical protein